MAAVALDRSILARLGVLEGTETLLPERAVLKLGWAELENVLPDHGLPRGVIEIAAMPRLGSRGASRLPESMTGGSTVIAISAIAAMHRRDEEAWAAWITPMCSSKNGDVSPSLYAPALARAGVDLDRLLVVRPPPEALARTVVKVAASGAFGLLVVDVPNPNDLAPARTSKSVAGGSGAGDVIVRKLALAAEESGTTSLLLTSAVAKRSIPLPVALRLEVERRPDSLSVRVTKDRRGIGSSQNVVRLVS
jgi:hypothetical protein